MNYVALSSLNRSIHLLALVSMVWLAACSRGQLPAQTTSVTQASGTPKECQPTAPDMLGPFYEPGAPLRDSVGEGYVLSGVVRSSADCSPIPNAQIEIWMAGPDGEYRDDYRATLYSDAGGVYRFESHFPPPYSGRPSHHHLQVSAAGFETLVTQHYPQSGQSEATFDVVLVANP
jgi:protocatechuate 3,4-dioxygenase beta subunit